MKYLSTRLLCCLLAVSPALAQPVLINEIMFHPAPAVPEDSGQEWIELFNAGTNAVDVSAWRFDAGVSFTFPPNTLIPAGGYVVVAASLTNFQAHYPAVASVLGDWTGHLSNTR
jgi:hypothetical protein